MAKATIYYLLSKTGQKNNLKTGGDGHSLRKVEADVTGENIDLFNINEDGILTLYSGFSGFGGNGKPEFQSFTIGFDVLLSDEENPSVISRTGKIEYDALLSFEEILTLHKNFTAGLEKTKTEAHERADKITEEKKAGERIQQEKFEIWFTAHASELLKERRKGGYSWKPLAGEELFNFLVNEIDQAKDSFSMEKQKEFLQVRETPDLSEIKRENKILSDLEALKFEFISEISAQIHWYDYARYAKYDTAYYYDSEKSNPPHAVTNKSCYTIMIRFKCPALGTGEIERFIL